MSEITAELYRQRAIDFSRGVLLMRNDQEYRQATALLAIHSAISYSDALRSELGEKNLKLENHKQASGELKRLLSSKPWVTTQGLKPYDLLLSRKDAVAYGDRRLDENDFAHVLSSAERFIAWVDYVRRQLRSTERRMNA